MAQQMCEYVMNSWCRSLDCDIVMYGYHASGAARVGVWVLRWTHTFYLEDQNFNI